MDSNKNLQTSIEPWLSVSTSAKAVAFYSEAFGAKETYRIEDPDGNAVVKLSIDSATFWLSDAPLNDVIENVGGGSVRMILNVADPDTVFARALKAGAIEIFPVEEAHGWRLGRLADPFGLHWEIGKELSE